MRKKRTDNRLPGTSVYLVYLVAELLAALYFQGRIVLEPKWYGLNLI